MKYQHAYESDKSGEIQNHCYGRLIAHENLRLPEYQERLKTVREGMGMGCHLTDIDQPVMMTSGRRAGERLGCA